MSKQTSVTGTSVSRVHSKACTKCKVVKPISSFKPRSDRPNQYRSRCKACTYLDNKKYGKYASPEKKRARDIRARPWRYTGRQNSSPAAPQPNDTPFVAWMRKVIKAKRKKTNNCTLDNAWIAKWAKVQECPVLGMPFSKPGTRSGKSPCPRSPSFDRIDPNEGYTPENTRVVSYFINVAKNAWPEEQFRLLVLATANHMRH